jgi:hypothetical protein
MDRRARITGTFAIGVLAIGAHACDGATGSSPAPIVFRAQAADVDFESAVPAVLDLALGSNASAFVFSASAGSNRGVWSVRATLTREQVFAGSVSLDIGSSVSAPASTQIHGSTRLEADSGKLDVSFGQGASAGTVTMASPDLLNSTFTGALSVECLVPASTLPPASAPATGGTMSGDGSELLVLDVAFETDACRPFAVLR